MRIRAKEIRRTRKRQEERILDKVKAARAARPAPKPTRSATRPTAGGAASGGSPSGGTATRPAAAPRQRAPRPAAPPAAPAPEAPSGDS